VRRSSRVKNSGAAQSSEANAALLVIDDIESEMNPRMTIQDAHRKRVTLHHRPIGAHVARFRQPVFLCERDDLQTLQSPGNGSQNPVIKIALDGEQFCVRLFETEFGEVA
jgi:hypothetical protein